MKICDIMTDGVVCVGAAEPVTAAARLLKQHNVGALPVCDNTGRLKGIITDRDIIMRCVAAEGNPKEMRVQDIMSRGIITVSPFDDVEKAARLMSEDQVRRLPVMDAGKLVGVLALSDMARSCNCEMEAAGALTEISANIRRK